MVNGAVIVSHIPPRVSENHPRTPPRADCGPKIYPIAAPKARNGAITISNRPPKIPFTVSTTKLIGTMIKVLTPSHIAFKPPMISPSNIIPIPLKIALNPSNTDIIAVPNAVKGAINISNSPPKSPPTVSIINPIGTTNKSTIKENIFLRDSTSGNASRASARPCIPRAPNAQTVMSLSIWIGSPINQSNSFIIPSLSPPKMPPTANPSMKPVMKPIAAVIPATTAMIGSARGAKNPTNAVIAGTSPARASLIDANPVKNPPLDSSSSLSPCPILPKSLFVVSVAVKLASAARLASPASSDDAAPLGPAVGGLIALKILSAIDNRVFSVASFSKVD